MVRALPPPRRSHTGIRWQIVLVVLLAAALLVIPALAVLFVLSQREVGILAACAGIMLGVFGVLACLLPYVVLLGAILGMNVVYRRATGVLQQGERLAHSVNVGTSRASRLIAAPVIATRRRLAWIGHIARLPSPR